MPFSINVGDLFADIGRLLTIFHASEPQIVAFGAEAVAAVNAVGAANKGSRTIQAVVAKVNAGATITSAELDALNAVAPQAGALVAAVGGAVQG